MIKNCYICRNRKFCKVADKRENPTKSCAFCYPTEEAEMRETDAYKLGRADGKAEVIDKINNAIEELLKEPQYQHEGEDWMNGLIMAQEILYNMQSELEEKNNDT